MAQIQVSKNGHQRGFLQTFWPALKDYCVGNTGELYLIPLIDSFDGGNCYLIFILSLHVANHFLIFSTSGLVLLRYAMHIDLIPGDVFLEWMRLAHCYSQVVDRFCERTTCSSNELGNLLISRESQVILGWVRSWIWFTQLEFCSIPSL